MINLTATFILLGFLVGGFQHYDPGFVGNRCASDFQGRDWFEFPYAHLSQKPVEWG